jgi:hypothetical protein
MPDLVQESCLRFHSFHTRSFWKYLRTPEGIRGVCQYADKGRRVFDTPPLACDLPKFRVLHRSLFERGSIVAILPTSRITIGNPHLSASLERNLPGVGRFSLICDSQLPSEEE